MGAVKLSEACPEHAEGSMYLLSATWTSFDSACAERSRGAQDDQVTVPHSVKLGVSNLILSVVSL